MTTFGFSNGALKPKLERGQFVMAKEEKLECQRCQSNSRLSWVEQGPSEMHRYMVSCARCRKFIKWGTEAQFKQAERAGSAILVKFRDRGSIEKFFTSD